jgi:hypothetical protein
MQTPLTQCQVARFRRQARSKQSARPTRKESLVDSQNNPANTEQSPAMISHRHLPHPHHPVSALALPSRTMSRQTRTQIRRSTQALRWNASSASTNVRTRTRMDSLASVDKFLSASVYVVFFTAEGYAMRRRQ